MAFNFTNLNGEFYVVGLGASAGGLDALEAFFSNLPNVSGVSFVIVQHLSYEFHSLMAEILASKTTLPIETIENGSLIKSNRIYLIPPGNLLEIKLRKFKLKPIKNHSYTDAAIDYFFKSLAKDKGAYAVGVVLSGAGYDGKTGSLLIKESGGAVFVQDPFTAKFSSMPLAAIETGIVENVVKAEQLPASIVKYLTLQSSNKNEIGIPESELKSIIKIIEEKTGEDFSYYKPGALHRRILRRIKVNAFEYVPEYINFLQNSPGEAEVLRNDLLIGYTKFFRDDKAFESLKENVLTNLIVEADKKNSMITIWDIACSTGEETYGIAILLDEKIKELGLNVDFKILATDIDEKSLAFAKKGKYNLQLEKDVPEKYLNLYFEKTGRYYQVIPEIKEKIEFIRHNVIDEPNFIENDFIICRNLLIYFKSEVQKQVISKLTLSLNTGGYLFLGDSESPGEFRNCYNVIDSQNKIFKLESANNLKRLYDDFLIHDYGKSYKSYVTELTLKADNEILNELPHSAVLIDYDYRLIKTYGDLSVYLDDFKYAQGDYIIKKLKPEFSIFLISLLHKIKLNKVQTPITTQIGASNVSLKISCIQLYENRFFLCKFSYPVNFKGNQETYLDDTPYVDLRERNRKLSAENSAMKNVLEEAYLEMDKIIEVNAKLESAMVSIEEFFNMSGIGLIFVDSNLNITGFTDIVLEYVDKTNFKPGLHVSKIIFKFNYETLQDDAKYCIENETKYLTLVEFEKKQIVVKISPSNIFSDTGAIISVFEIRD